MFHRLTVSTAVLSLIWLAACQQSTPTPASIPTLGPVSTSTQAVPAAGGTATPSSPQTGSATPESNTFPLAILVMRAKSYPGSDLVIEQTLPGGANYNRYVASYQSDGLKLYGLLTTPTGTKPAGGWPILILNHGYIPPSEYSTTESYARVDELIAQAGYIVFKPDYRGHGNSPGTPCQIYICPDYVADSLNALASVKKLPDANPDKVGVWGHSMGGNVTMHELVISHDIKAAVLMAGVVGSYSDILDWWRARVASGVLTTQNDQRSEQLVEQMVNTYGTPQSNPGFWNAIDPTNYVADINVPVLVQVGTSDTVVPPRFSQNLANQLQTAGKNVELHIYPGADHNLAPNTTAAVQEAIAFFNQYLK